LHLLGLLHHREDVHESISSTSRISAGKTSRSPCTPEEDNASAFKSRLGALPAGGAAWLPSDGADAVLVCIAVTGMRLPDSRSATDSSQLRFCSSCIRATFWFDANVNVMRSSVTSIRCACATARLYSVFLTERISASKASFRAFCGATTLRAGATVSLAGASGPAPAASTPAGGATDARVGAGVPLVDALVSRVGATVLLVGAMALLVGAVLLPVGPVIA